MDVVVPLIVFAAAMLQSYTSAKELGKPRKAELEWWITEDELIDEIPPWKPIEKRRGRRMLVKMRPEDVAREIRHMNLVLIGWVMLDFAAGIAVVQAILN